jgi:pimeloyl-ACP methyl ester carboxylesterase
MSAKAIAIETSAMKFEAFVEGPESGELVLMLHGFPQFANAWLPLMHSVAKAGFRAAAVNQRGYSPEARPEPLGEYSVQNLVGDIQAFADNLGAQRFHLIGHDWGAFLAWMYAAQFPARLQSLTSLSTPHPDAFWSAVETDEDQKKRSHYLMLFRMPDGAAERVLAADDFAMLRRVYQGKLSAASVRQNIGKMRKPGALTASLNWYRALKPQRIGRVDVQTLYIWGSDDMAAGRKAALDTANYVGATYKFVELEGKSHWLLEEEFDVVTQLVLDHISAAASLGQKRLKR